MNRVIIIVLCFGGMIVAGAGAVIVPDLGDDMIIEAREEVWIDVEGSSLTSIELPNGDYQIWIPDRNPDEQDFEHYDFGVSRYDPLVDDTSSVDVLWADGMDVEVVDGINCEHFCSFTIEPGGSYWYESHSNFKVGDDHFKIYFLREPSWMDGPCSMVGLALIILGAVGIGATMVLSVLNRPSTYGAF